MGGLFDVSTFEEGEDTFRSACIECKIGERKLKLGKGASLSSDTATYFDNGFPAGNDSWFADCASATIHELPFGFMQCTFHADTYQCE